jgi:hypothetical protein
MGRFLKDVILLEEAGEELGEQDYRLRAHIASPSLS